MILLLLLLVLAICFYRSTSLHPGLAILIAGLALGLLIYRIGQAISAARRVEHKRSAAGALDCALFTLLQGLDLPQRSHIYVMLLPQARLWFDYGFGGRILPCQAISHIWRLDRDDCRILSQPDKYAKLQACYPQVEGLDFIAGQYRKAAWNDLVVIQSKGEEASSTIVLWPYLTCQSLAILKRPELAAAREDASVKDLWQKLSTQESVTPVDDSKDDE